VDFVTGEVMRAIVLRPQPARPVGESVRQLEPRPTRQPLRRIAAGGGDGWKAKLCWWASRLAHQLIHQPGEPVGVLTSLFSLVLLLFLTAPASAYIHFPPQSLPKMCKHSTHIRILKVKEFDKEKGVIVYEVVEKLKGKESLAKSFKHAIGKPTDESKPIFDWLAEGKQAVMFSIEGGNILCGYVFIDEFCYSIDYNIKNDFWLLIRTDPEMAACFHGSVDACQQVTADLLAGKEVTVPVKEGIEPLPNTERAKRVPALNEILLKNRR
jgi:hypothetical protein